MADPAHARGSALSERTAGLTTAAQFRLQREALEAEEALVNSRGGQVPGGAQAVQEAGIGPAFVSAPGAPLAPPARKRRRRAAAPKGVQASLLSFAADGDSDGESEAKMSKNEAQKSENEAKKSENEAKKSENGAKTSENGAKTSGENGAETEGKVGGETGELVAGSAAVAPVIPKNPLVNTAFLPDRARDASDHRLRLELQKEWLESQRIVRGEALRITYSYWDGSGNRKTAVVKKGDSVGEFLRICLKDLSKEVRDLRYATVDNLLYVKEDLILPHHYTFYEFIVARARGKSGPLFQFDVRDDIREIQDATVEKEETHAGKVLTRGFYEKHKHQFPYSRWAVYDPAVRYDKYTIKGK
eukprot:TRINITY_DN9495_c0_g1_i8.p2 TRINITY_DN9495_c0_g1~~TRINITY_DN9495_c0_g1_i8.p2  ORF type:complete len:359 (-),score=81.06 TRINITY_DN9495_c0_g1_i8:31-1107(-)